MEQTVIKWKSCVLPEQTDAKILHTFGYDFVPVIIVGRYTYHSPLSISITKRIKRKKTGCQFIDENNNILQTPVDNQWHWQSEMVEIIAWGPLPAEDDPRWILCANQLPEDMIDNLEHETGRGYQGISVLALCETSCQLEVCPAMKKYHI